MEIVCPACPIKNKVKYMKTYSWVAIFDWDGVIIDSAAYHERSWHLLAAEAGKTLPVDFFKKTFGIKSEWIIPHVLHWTQDSAQVKELCHKRDVFYREMITKEGIDPLPGTVTWLERLKKAGIPCAIGSSTVRANIDLVLQQKNLAAFFQFIVSAEDVKQGKPDPQVFLKAAAGLRADPHHCVVFEDAHVGLQAARAAGMHVVGVASTHEAETLAEADLVCHRLDELQVDELNKWFCKPR